MSKIPFWEKKNGGVISEIISFQAKKKKEYHEKIIKIEKECLEEMRSYRPTKTKNKKIKEIHEDDYKKMIADRSIKIKKCSVDKRRYVSFDFQACSDCYSVRNSPYLLMSGFAMMFRTFE